MKKRSARVRRGTPARRQALALARRTSALPPAKRAAVEELIERLLGDDRQLVAAATRSSEVVFGKIWDNPDDATYDSL
jgi:hypothetical protein